MHLQRPHPQYLPCIQTFQTGQLLYNQTCKQLIGLNNLAYQNNQNLDLINEEEKLLKKKLANVPGVPQLIARGDEKIQQNNYHYAVYEKYGPSLKLCFKFMEKHFQLQTICLIAINTLTVLEKIHCKLIVHRNLRPKKILTKIQKTDLIIIDYKHAEKYKKTNGTFLSFNENRRLQNRQFINKYSSLNTHLGLGCSPKDDLESLGFILVYFLRRGKLFSKETKSKDDRIKFIEEEKMKMIPEKFFKDLPIELIQYFQFVRMTDITQYPYPDYEFLKKIFKGLLQKLNIPNETSYEWSSKLILKSRNRLQLCSEDSLNPEQNTNYLSPNQEQQQRSKLEKYVKQQIPESMAEDDTINRNLSVKFNQSDDDEPLAAKMAGVKLIKPKFKQNLATN